MAESAFYRWLSKAGSARPDAPALTFWRPPTRGYTDTYTYRELFERVEQLSNRLASVYEDPAAPLGILLSSQEDQVLHYLAGLHAGAVPALLTPPNRKLNRAYYQKTMTEVLRRCQFGAVVSDVEGIDVNAPLLEPFTFANHPTEHSSSQPDQGLEEAIDASFIQFSSGTTGIKRGVIVSDEAVMSQLQTYADALSLSPHDVVVSWLPLYHDMGFIACLNMPLAFGVHSVMMDPVDWVSDPSIYLKVVSQYGGTLSWHPNFAFAFMAQRADRSLEDVDLSTLRGLVNCSEPVTQESQQAFLERFRRLGLSENVFKGCYAMAETTFALTHGNSDDPQYSDLNGPVDGTQSGTSAGYVAVGKALPGVEIMIMSPEDRRELPERVIGELWVKSPFNFSGYYRDPEATANAIVDGWYRTGDLGYRVGEHYYIAGRHKDVMIVGGVNVFPQDIEDLVSQTDRVHPGRVAAFSTFDDRMQTERVVVVAETGFHETPEASQITIEIRQTILAAFQITNFHVRLVPPGWLIKSTSGKVARAANRSKWLEEKEESAPGVNRKP